MPFFFFPLPLALPPPLGAAEEEDPDGAATRPRARSVCRTAGITGDALLSLVDRAQDEGLIEKVAEHYYASSVIRGVMHSIRQNCLGNDEVLDIPKLRDGLDTSRKFLIPLLEYIDSLGLTVLRGGVRRLLPSSAISRELAAERP